MYERLEEITLAEQETAERYDHTVSVCMAAGCMSSQSGAIKEAIDKEVEMCIRDRSTATSGPWAQRPMQPTPRTRHQRSSPLASTSLSMASLIAPLCDDMQPAAMHTLTVWS